MNYSYSAVKYAQKLEIHQKRVIYNKKCNKIMNGEKFGKKKRIAGKKKKVYKKAK